MNSSNSKIQIVSNSIPNIPWQERPIGDISVVWRYSSNPVIPRNPFPTANSVFNSAVVPFNGKFAGVFRCDDTSRLQNLHAGFSDNAIDWKINPEPIRFIGADSEIAKWNFGYDPRVVWLEDRFYITWCNDYHGPTIGVAWTQDFKTFHQIENSFLPYNRNGVLFPRKINGKYHLLSRPSDGGHTAFGDIFVSSSTDMVHWGCHRHVMSKGGTPWQGTKIGAGPIPIETTEGWLMFYHGVLSSCNGMVYAWSAALLDLEKPWKVIHRPKPYLLAPWEIYECVGDVPNVTFPTSALTDATTGRIAIYYGCADTVTGIAFCQVDEVIAWLKSNSL